MKPVHCKNCNKLLMEAQVLVAVLVCQRCKHKAEYRLLTEDFLYQLRHENIADE